MNKLTEEQKERRREYDRQRYKKNKPTEEQKERTREYNRQWYKKNKESCKQKSKEYRIINKELLRKNGRRYYYERGGKEKQKENKIKRLNNDINFKLRERVCNRVRMYFLSVFNEQQRKKYKFCSSLDLLGCSVQELKLHLEKQFKPGMNWKNYGIDGWHIDHVKPLCSFNLTKLMEQKKAFHYINLQPLWAKENLSKNGKY